MQVLPPLAAPDASEDERARAIMARLVARIGAPSLEDYRRAYAGCGVAWPGDKEIWRRHHSTMIGAVTLFATVTLLAASRSGRGLPESHSLLGPLRRKREAQPTTRSTIMQNWLGTITHHLKPKRHPSS
jgi:hypothetical protein